MMESSLYREIFEEGEAKGKAEGEAKGKAELLIRLLTMRLSRVAPEVRQAIQTQAQAAPDVLSLWFDEAVLADTAKAVQRVIRKITAAHPVVGTPRS